MSKVDEPTTVPKAEHSDEASFSDSSPDPDEQNSIQENAQVQKRKGGRKPIYATSEERKQRNRQAQAAFRERRTEYIKQLEATIKHHEDSLQNLQQSHRSAADECLMLRYKNSLLERILLEKGIDVQAELKSKADSACMGPNSMPSSGISQQFPLQRSALHRPSHPRRSVTGPGSKTHQRSASSSNIIGKDSPRLHGTHYSMALSPTLTKTSGILAQAGMISPNVDLQAQQQPQPLSKNRHYAPRRHSGLVNSTSAPRLKIVTANARPESRDSEAGSASETHSAYYTSPFQSHIEQLVLEQEYDAHADMLEDQDLSERPPGPGPYPQDFHQHSPHDQQPPMGMQSEPPPMRPLHTMHPPHTSHMIDSRNPAYGSMNQSFDVYDPMLDADPFGLTASMHFPTQFTFQESSMRH